MTDVSEFRLAAGDFGTFGMDLARPECVWIDADGVWCSDGRGGVSQVKADAPAVTLGHGITEPNGISRRADGSFVAAGLGDGKVYRIAPDGTTSVILDSIDGKPLGAVNCAWADGERTWISMMSTSFPWPVSMNEGPKGYIVLLDDKGARVVADGLHQTNELKVSPDGRHLYTVETLGRRIVRFPIRDDGSLGAKDVVGPDDLGHGAYPDGFAFDVEGNIWLTLIIRNGIGVIDRSGTLHTVYEEPQNGAVDRLVASIAAGNADLDAMRACVGTHLPFPTSLAFGGEDGRTVFVGSLAAPHLFPFRAPVAGEPRHR
jgi:sugar lactone lactonase YvrE